LLFHLLIIEISYVHLCDVVVMVMMLCFMTSCWQKPWLPPSHCVITLGIYS